MSPDVLRQRIAAERDRSAAYRDRLGDPAHDACWPDDAEWMASVRRDADTAVARCDSALRRLDRHGEPEHDIGSGSALCPHDRWPWPCDDYTDLTSEYPEPAR